MNRNIDRRDLSEYAGKQIEIHEESGSGASKKVAAGRLISVDTVPTDDLTKDGQVFPSFDDTIVVLEGEDGERTERRLTAAQYVVNPSAS